MITTSWMWRAGLGTNGVTIDPDEGILMWLDDTAGCACWDSAAEQTYAEFRADGPAFGNVPEDVLVEVWAAIELLEGVREAHPQGANG